jgi:hypothetical protein
MTYHARDPNTFNSGARAGYGPARHGEIMRLNTRLVMRLNKRASMTLIICLTALGLKTRGAGAQVLLQYTPPGGPQETESRREQLERELGEARYRLGPIRIAPWATLRDVSYVRGIIFTGAPVPNDVTATAGAGFRAYLRNGPKATWTAQVLPEYVWWNRQTQRRQLNGRYSLGYSGFFNHLTLEVKAGRDQRQQIVTPEVPTPVSSRRDGAEILTELELSGAFSLFAAVSANRQDNLVEDVNDPDISSLRLLDRDERVERGGVRWRPNRRWSVALGGEHIAVDFTHQGTLDRSHSGTAPVTEVRFQGNHITFEADAAARSLSASRGAEFVPFDGVTGGGALTLGERGRRVRGILYSSRSLIYSLSPFYAYLVDQRLGAALLVGFGQRTLGRFFVEGGNNDYTAFAATTPHRREDVSSYGASLTITLHRSLSLGIEGLRSQFNSNLPGGDRSYTSVGTTISLTGFP